MRNNQDTRCNNQTIINNQISIIKQNNLFGYFNLKFGICLYLVVWLLVISPAAGAEEVTKIIAKVNNQAITSKDLDDYCQALQLQLVDDSNREIDPDESFRKTALKRLIEDKLILDEARRLKIEIHRSVIEDRLNQIVDSYETYDAFDQSLQERGFTVTRLKEKIKEQYLMREIIQMKVKSLVSVSPQEVSSYYNQNRDKMVSPDVYVFYVAVSDREADINKIADKIRNDGFSAALKQYPNELNKVESTKYELKKEIAELFDRIKEGEVSITQADNQYYLVFLSNAVGPRLLQLSEAERKINDYLWERKFKKKFTEWLSDLKEQAVIKIYDD